MTGLCSMAAFRFPAILGCLIPEASKYEKAYEGPKYRVYKV